METLIKQLHNNLLDFSHHEGTETFKGEAAVMVALFRGEQGPEVLLTRRAKVLNQHGGEVAFPGGMWEPGDHYPMDTALRESEEEVALAAEQVDIIGRLPTQQTAYGIKVAPVVGVLASKPQLIANPDEIESIFSVPLAFFLADERLRTDIFQRHHEGRQPSLKRWVPAYQYQQYEIWGFTSGVIISLLNRCLNANIGRANVAPEQNWYNGKVIAEH